jgi:hypothetical protein
MNCPNCGSEVQGSKELAQEWASGKLTWREQFVTRCKACGVAVLMKAEDGAIQKPIIELMQFPVFFQPPFAQAT